MPAHISLRESLELHAGHALKNHGALLGRVGLLTLSGHAASHTKLVSTSKGLEKLGRDPEDGPGADVPASLSELKHVQERVRIGREIVCTSYPACRTALNQFNGGKELFPKTATSFYPAMVKFSAPDGYRKKDHAAFKLEWDLFLKPGTEFDRALMQLFSQGWTVTLIKDRPPRHEQLKRMEGTKPGKSMLTLWTA